MFIAKKKKEICMFYWEGEDGGMHGERGDEVHREHQVVQAWAKFRAGEKDVQRIQPNIWSLSSSRTELQKT